MKLRYPKLVATITVGFGLTIGAAGPAYAIFLTPTTAQATSNYPFPVPAMMINSSGKVGGGSFTLPGQAHDNDVSANTMWHAGPNDGGLGGPTGDPPVVNDQKVRFDLGAGGNYNLSAAYVWNHNQSGNTGRGVNEFEIWVASTNVSPVFTQIGTTFNLLQANGLNTQAAQTVSFSANNVRLIEFRINSDHNALTSDYVGLSEVRFEGGLVPEPSAMAMALCGGLFL